ncbi:ABC transporter substrate-binding protein [Paenibacillus sp. PAMC21692]|uniref:ABC transporter substrate-binding protein n=1 Tax=Paenibacillus sp. PAMC21692 TaxID=2762320 RepID=UPI00164CE89D|nr:extracellular solute-binding protein [Paenibacillus sp. PAMC21692]QNK55019.1 extracellular solute-binding protein [Paenibacillus sp. PAMC21692]
MKKVKGLFVLLALTLLLAACSGGNGGSLDSGVGGDDQAADFTGDKKTVVIAVQGSNPFLEAAARQFEQEHTDIKIEIKSYMAIPEAVGDGMTAAISQADIEKYVQTVTTQIMAGKSSDLILMENLPQNKLVEKNVIVNLYDLMERDPEFAKDDYYQNVFKAAQDGDGLYAMPFAVNLDVIQGRTDLLKNANIDIDDRTWTWEQFKDISKQAKEQLGQDYFAFINVFPLNLLISYMEDNYDELVLPDGTANFDSEYFREMMRQIKSMYDENVLQAEFTYDYDKAIFSQSVFSNPETAMPFMARPTLQFFKSPTTKGESNGIPFRSWFNLGLNSKSKVRQEAWEFMKYLLSEEIQQSPELSGFPVNKKVAEMRIDEAASRLTNGNLEPGLEAVDPAAAQAIAKEMKTLLENTGIKLNVDFKVQSIAIEEFNAYMSGQKSAEAVSKLIQNRVMTYLNE